MQAALHEEDVQRALSTITSLTLSPPEHRLLSCFVQDAVDPKAAALYVLQRASRYGKYLIHMETELYNLLEGWKRLVERCRALNWPTKISFSYIANPSIIGDKVLGCGTIMLHYEAIKSMVGCLRLE
ncbi:hypothetical protein VC83_00211 [Pseudogymnoascus destructans]|uniref:Uncharacterized protein n=1 Tax=Pseudogymnoascus destructans TaxID=655981 RepID=A0A177APF4_9PEZI|nr:uncharacterized protein VC83_00211 [Pseudogymnoascus destructans]OAF63261.1 hypothetical protein VC83_00211 [Pseudogymnoascus destructans]